MPLGYRLLKKVQDELFDPSQLDRYTLLLSIGNRDIQLGVVQFGSSKCLLVEDYALENIRTITDRIGALQRLFSEHHFVKGGFWKQIKCSMKSHKFSLLPRMFYARETATDFLSLTAKLNPENEILYTCPHKTMSLVNVFAVDKQLSSWLVGMYSKKKIAFFHQGSVLIEGCLHMLASGHEKAVFFFLDKKVLHVSIVEKQRLFYYNQFSVHEVKDMLLSVRMVFSELAVGDSNLPAILYGNQPGNSSYHQQLRKLLPQLQLGSRPAFLQYPFPFDDVQENYYFDLFSIQGCSPARPAAVAYAR